jgi:tetratricopeptide (TPR) repeat protein
MEWMSRAKPEDSADFKELMARTLFGLGKYKDSERLFSELIDTDPFQKRYWNALASAQFMSEDYSNSIQSSEYAIAIDPDDTEGLLSKANGLYQLNNYKDALEYFRRYSEKEPDDEFSYMYQGTCLLNMNQNEEAIKVLEQAENVAPEDSPYLPDIYQELCFAYSELGDVDKGLDYLNKTDTLDCDHIGLMVVKGHVLLGAGRVEEAEKMYRQAIRESENAIPDEEHPGLSSSKTLMRWNC